VPAKLALTFVVALAIWLLIGYGQAQRACAHDPRFTCSPRNATNAVEIADAGKSWAYYGGLASGQTDHFHFILNRPTAVPWSLLVDARDAGNAARPSAMLYGARGDSIAQLKRCGSSTFYEPFSRESYLQSCIEHLDLKPGNYNIVVSMSGSTRQRYVMAIGEAERFSPFELPYVVGAIARIRALRY
jgi:hypothetical protein